MFYYVELHYSDYEDGNTVEQRKCFQYKSQAMKQAEDWGKEYNTSRYSTEVFECDLASGEVKELST